MPTDKGKVCAFAFLYSSEKNGEATPPPSETTLEHDLSDIYRDSVELLRKTPPSWQKPLWEHNPAPVFNKGRVVMMGDAAHVRHGPDGVLSGPPIHATSPFNGQGAAQAFEDAAVLKTLFGEIKTFDQIPAAFATFDKTRLERSQQVVMTCREFGDIYMGEDIDVGKAAKIIAAGDEHGNDGPVDEQQEEAINMFRELIRGV